VKTVNVMIKGTSCQMYYDKYKSLLRFGIVGCINTGVDFGVFTILISLLGLKHYLICQVAGFSMGIINSFVLNKLWTFENKRSGISTSAQFIKFVGVNLVSLGFSLFGLKILSGNRGVNIYIAKVIVTLFTQVINYFGYKLWVFNNRLQKGKVNLT
jgi:putative flippase GtrA